MNNWFTIGTDRTDGQGFWGLPYALAIMLTTSFTKGFCTFTDRVFISPSVPTDNFDLPMENWFTIGTDRTDGQGFWGLPYALAIMLTTSFTKGFCTFTDRVFISPSVPTDNDGRNNITKLTVGMLASVLDNPLLLVDNVTLTVYKVMSFNIRSRTPDENTTLGRECNLCVVISFVQQNQSSTYYVGLYTWLRYSHKFQFVTSC